MGYKPVVLALLLLLVVSLIWLGGGLICKTDSGFQICRGISGRIITKKWGDTDGRTIVFSNRPNSFFNGLGYLDIGTTDTPWAVIGYFDRVEFISNSPDEYLWLVDSRGRDLVKGRLIFNNLPYDGRQTDFLLEKLLDSSANPYDPVYATLWPNVTRAKINNFLKKGDILAVVPVKDDLSKIKADPKVEVGIVRVIFRRYYGIGVFLNQSR